MAEATGTTTTTTQENKTTTTAPPAGSPEAQVLELQKQNADLLKETLAKKEQIKALETKKADEEAEALKTQNKFKELYEGQLPKAKRADELEPVLTTMLESEIASVPEDKRDLIPAFEKPEQKLLWIRTAKEKGLFGATAKPPVTTVTSKVNSDGTLPEFVSWGANDPRLSTLTTDQFVVWKKHNNKPSTGVRGWGSNR